MRTLSWRDLLALAVSMEERGRSFYHNLATHAKNAEAAAIFNRLAAEEEEHAQRFRIGFAEDAGIPVSLEQAAYLQALSRTNAFANDESALNDPRRALGVAVEAEKESILFYTELSVLAKEEKAQAVLARLLREEKLHLVEIRERMEEEDWD